MLLAIAVRAVIFVASGKVLLRHAKFAPMPVRITPDIVVICLARSSTFYGMVSSFISPISTINHYGVKTNPKCRVHKTGDRLYLRVVAGVAGSHGLAGLDLHLGCGSTKSSLWYQLFAISRHC